jgi:hypothetical protein
MTVAEVLELFIVSHAEEHLVHVQAALRSHLILKELGPDDAGRCSGREIHMTFIPRMALFTLGAVEQLTESGSLRSCP